MKRLLTILLLAIVFAIPAAAQQVELPSPEEIVGQPKGQPLSGEALEVKTKEVASLLRCPTCQGLSVYDSPAAMAVNMKHQVRDLVAAGYETDQVLQYFEASYGEFVRLAPKMSGVNWLVWAAPILLLAVGVWAVVAYLKRSGGAAAKETPAATAAVEDDPELRPYLLKVRELAYGWPGGEPPAGGER